MSDASKRTWEKVDALIEARLRGDDTWSMRMDISKSLGRFKEECPPKGKTVEEATLDRLIKSRDLFAWYRKRAKKTLREEKPEGDERKKLEAYIWAMHFIHQAIVYRIEKMTGVIDEREKRKIQRKKKKADNERGDRENIVDNAISGS